MICRLSRRSCHHVTRSCAVEANVVALDYAPVTTVPEGAADSGSVLYVHSQTAARKEDGYGFAICA